MGEESVEQKKKEMETNQWKLIPLLSFTIFFSVLNGTMFNVAVPNIAEEFQLMPSEVSWVVTGFIVFFALASVTYGKLADMYPVKNLITIGLILFNLGSLLGFLSQWYPMLVASRFIQASGAGAIPALAMLTATRYFPVHMRGKVLGAIASTVGVGSGIGPVVGGFVVSTFHWRYLFIVSVFTLISIVLFRKWLPIEEKQQGNFDVRGAVLVGGGIAALLIFITQMNGWMLLLSVLLITGFVVHIHRVQRPFVAPSMFLNKKYRNSLIAGFLSVSTIFGMMFMVPIMLRELNGLNTLEIGLVMFPGAMSAAIMGTIGGKLVDKKGGVPIVYSGLGFLSISYLLLSSFAGTQSWLIAIVLMLTYTGFAFIQSALAGTVAGTLPKEHTGVGMGIYNLMFFMSGAIGSAIVGKGLDFNATFSINPLSFIPAGYTYSNIFFVFIPSICIAAGLVFYTFHRASFIYHKSPE